MLIICKSDSLSIRDKIINKVVNQNEINKENIFHFDYDEKDDFNKAITEYLTLDFMNEKKLVILKNSEFINKVNPETGEYKKFSDLVDVDNENILILTVEKINKTGKINKAFKGKIDILEKNAPEEKELNAFIKTFLEARNIYYEYDVITTISKAVGHNFDLMVAELNKLELVSNEKLNSEFVSKVLINTYEENIFKLADSVMTKDINKVEKMIDSLRSQGASYYLVSKSLILEMSRFYFYNNLKFNNDIKLQDKSENGIVNNGFLKIHDHLKNIVYETIIEMIKAKLENFIFSDAIQKIWMNPIQFNVEEPYFVMKKILVNELTKFLD